MIMFDYFETFNVTVVCASVGAAGRIAYALIPLVCNGSTFGMERKIDLRLIDVDFSMVKLQGKHTSLRKNNLHDIVSLTLGNKMIETSNTFR